MARVCGLGVRGKRRRWSNDHGGMWGPLEDGRLEMRSIAIFGADGSRLGWVGVVVGCEEKSVQSTLPTWSRLFRFGVWVCAGEDFALVDFHFGTREEFSLRLQISCAACGPLRARFDKDLLKFIH